MKYEEWIKYEEARLCHQDMHTLKARVTVNGRTLSSLTVDEMLVLIRAWVTVKAPHLQTISEPPASQALASNNARAL